MYCPTSVVLYVFEVFVCFVDAPPFRLINGRGSGEQGVLYLENSLNQVAKVHGTPGDDDHIFVLKIDQSVAGNEKLVMWDETINTALWTYP